ncbi:hypothetical protein BDR03DRAFT_1013617 [Suillus americanus]|nr:hypothetical protein BDR03DRAFT_1013617 [Suillus americanus]
MADTVQNASSVLATAFLEIQNVDLQDTLSNQNIELLTMLPSCELGGTNGNKGLVFLSICFDWQYISGRVNPMTAPLKAQVSNLLGYILCLRNDSTLI